MRTQDETTLNEKAIQEIRQFHCDKQEDKDHSCVGQMLVTKDGICLACPLCGVADSRHINEIINGDIKGQFVFIAKASK